MGKQFSRNITTWYDQNKRDLPWRNYSDPYTIRLSEILLQQTRVDQGLPYFLKFKEMYPTVQDLAAAPIEQILKIWQGLGYYSRARNLHHTARFVVNEYNGKFPSAYKDLLQLKGVGHYTAAAIASIAFSEAVPVVDGNVLRIVSRYFGITEPVDNRQVISKIRDICQEEMKGQIPGDFNQAIMEFGSLQCRPKNPDCEICPLKKSCFALSRNLVGDLPFKERKTKTKKVNYHFFVLNHAENTVLEQRPSRGIWASLFQFPMLESPNGSSDIDLEMASKFLMNKGLKMQDPVMVRHSKMHHVLSHRKIEASFWEISCKKLEIKPNSAIFEIDRSRVLREYAVPRLIEKYIGTKS